MSVVLELCMKFVVLHSVFWEKQVFCYITKQSLELYPLSAIIPPLPLPLWTCEDGIYISSCNLMWKGFCWGLYLLQDSVLPFSRFPPPVAKSISLMKYPYSKWDACTAKGLLAPSKSYFLADSNCMPIMIPYSDPCFNFT